MNFSKYSRVLRQKKFNLLFDLKINYIPNELKLSLFIIEYYHQQLPEGSMLINTVLQTIFPITRSILKIHSSLIILYQITFFFVGFKFVLEKLILLQHVHFLTVISLSLDHSVSFITNNCPLYSA